MSGPSIPPPFEPLAHRPFSFYPPVLHIEHNEWRFRRATWSELLVVNTKTGEEIWIPRRFVGEVSSVDEPVMILGLTKELEYVGGQIIPHVRRVIEMPRAVNDPFPVRSEPQSSQTAPVVGIKLESGTESRIGKLIMMVLAIGILGCVLVISFFRGGRDGSRVNYSPIMQSELQLTERDDYHAVVRGLGTPATDQWRSEQGEMQYRVLRYPERGIAAILMGVDRDKALYIGAVDLNTWRPVHYVSLPGGKNTYSMLKSIPRF